MNNSDEVIEDDDINLVIQSSFTSLPNFNHRMNDFYSREVINSPPDDNEEEE